MKVIEKIDERVGVGPKSPLPILRRFRRWVLGKQRPSLTVQIFFYVLLFFAIWEILWSVLGIVTMNTLIDINAQKQYDFVAFVQQRSEDLGLNPEKIEVNLTTHFILQLQLWSLIIVSSIFAYRKKYFAHWALGILLFVVGVEFLVMLNLNFLLEEVSTWEKVVWGIGFVWNLLFLLILKRRRGKQFAKSLEIQDEPPVNSSSDTR